MADINDVDPEVNYELIRLKKINSDLNRRYIEALLVEQADRYRILDEFRNVIVQKLIGMRLMMDAFLKNQNSVNMDSIALRELLTSTIESAHLLADNIAPHVLLEMGLEASIHELFKQYTKDRHIFHCITCDVEVGLINKTTKLILYQLIKELLHGIVHVCHADTVRIDMRMGNGTIKIIVEDNGVQFDLTEIICTGQCSERSFLLEAAELVRLLRGIAWSEKSRGMNTTCIVIPLKKQL